MFEFEESNGFDQIPVKAIDEMYATAGIYTIVEDGTVKGFYNEESVA